MIRSMTGFARRERQGPWGTLSVELRTVNHRYLEIALRLPDELRSLDGDFRQQIGAALRRGKVDANVFLKSVNVVAPTFELNQEVVQHVAAKVRQIAQTLGDIAPINAVDVLRWPGAIREAEQDIQPLLTAALELMPDALNELNAMRAREGARIRDLLK